MTTKRLAAIVIACCATIFAASAQQQMLTILMHVKEGFGNTYLDKGLTMTVTDAATGDTIMIPGADGKPIPAVFDASKQYVGQHWSTGIYPVAVKVPRAKGRYIILVSYPEYETEEVPLVIEHIGARENERKLPDVTLYKARSRKLDEMTVTASKVKFYHKGDTLVYNADAFSLAHGSMLDALVEQLPGVEIREGGQIYVNGKYVESLMLNGKDFFRGDNQLMLNNLGAYIVKDIAVYDKYGETSRLAGRQLENDKQYVMDVRLKKEYAKGYILNLEAGGGTSSRYMGRMFGMWFTNRSRLTLIGAVNNVNDSRQPGKTSSWTMTRNPGDFRTKTGGLDYMVSAEDGKWETSGNTTIEHTRALNTSTTDRTNFLSGGDTYERIMSRQLGHDLKISTSNGFSLKPEGKSLHIGQSLNYRKDDQRGGSFSAAFNREFEESTRKILEYVYSGQTGSFGDHVINTVLNENLHRGHTLDAGGNISGNMRVPYSPDLLGFFASGKYKEKRYDDFRLYDINFAETGSSTVDNQYIRNRPDREHELNAGITYNYLYSPEGSLEVKPCWTYMHSRRNSALYRLDRLADAGIFGQIPSGYEAALDPDQSNVSHEYSNTAQAILFWMHNKKLPESKQLMLTASGAIKVDWRHLDYRQGAANSAISRRDAEIEIGQAGATYMAGTNTFKLLYNRHIDYVPLNRLVDITDSRDPMNIFRGAPSLKNAATNGLNFQWMKRVWGRHRWSENVDLNFRWIDNALVSGYTYDPATGVRTYSMYNTSGNWQAMASHGINKNFGPSDQFIFNANTDATYGKSADMVGYGDAAVERTWVKNLNLGQGLKLTYMKGRNYITLNGRVDWRDTRGNRDGFNNFSATTLQYGLTGLVNLPKSITLSSDLTAYTRRGYADPSLNTTDVVWNARISYAIPGGKWVIMLDGFDLLHQLSNVSYNVNAQGRTETYTNVLPRYAMLHVQYRLNIQPKKR
ncbi:hypothetical protein [Paramuribaculum intestinale]|uniref:hypothetical protein n=1 Tax=Paramuribaculum intestinale TaxID=2094151 RepID=UPI0025A9CBD8|nr:hypothetical protein [Paramuribaculum intestinale]